ncbi:MAG: glycosyltransferase family 39 protein [Verrucomicrobiae bacterium]|nr:glycosyltransferase family 39 protein [Verrucomicrobiae bacterium]
MIQERWLLVTVLFLAGGWWIAGELVDAKKPWVVQEMVDAREAAGKSQPTRTYREIWVWYGAAGSALLLVALGITARWWARPAKIELGDAPAFGRGLAVRKFGWILLAVVVVGAVPRLARMNLSFWGDEDWALTAHAWGTFSEHEDGSLEFERHPWQTAIFYNARANNHVFQTILSKFCFETWNHLRGCGEEHIEEWATRLPSLIAGLVGIAAIGLWLRDLGHPLAGIIAAATVAVHPNHLRYSAEARGYGMAMTFLTLSSWMLCKALGKDSRWCHWILFALFQAMALYSFTASIYVLMLLNAGVVVLLVRRLRADRSCGALESLKRWFVVNAVSGAIYATLAIPIVIQTMHYLESSKTFAWEMTAEHYQMLWARVFVGFDYGMSHPDNPLDVGLAVTPGGVLMLVVFTALFLFSIRATVRIAGWNALLLLAPVAAGLVAIGHGVVKGHAVFPQYLLPSFPAAVAVFSLLLAGSGERLSRLVSKNTGGRAWLIAPTVAVLGIYVVIFWKGLSVQISHPTENLRAAAEVTRWQHESERYADDSKAIVVSLWRSWEIYDPRLRFRVRTADELEAVIAEAKSEGKELYVVVGHKGLAQELNADILAMLDDSGQFEELETLWAPEYFLTLFPYRMK